MVASKQVDFLVFSYNQHFKNYKSCSSERVHDIELKFML